MNRRATARVARWLAALVACAAWAAPGAAFGESRALHADVREGNAVLVGSSSFNQSFGHIIARELQRRGYQVTRKGVGGAGLARPDYRDMNGVVDALPINENTAAVFVYLGVNDAQAVWLYPHERIAFGFTSVPFGAADWDVVYARRAHEFLDRICQRGARRAVVLLPVDVNRIELQRRLVRIRELQEQAAADTSCAVVVSTAGDAGHFEVAGIPTRMPDGFHMSARGAQIVWERIQPKVERLLSPDPAR